MKNETRVYDDSYPKEPIGGGNPYWRCSSCKVSAPQINGSLENHLDDCSYVENKKIMEEVVALRAAVASLTRALTAVPCICFKDAIP